VRLFLTHPLHDLIPGPVEVDEHPLVVGGLFSEECLGLCLLLLLALLFCFQLSGPLLVHEHVEGVWQQVLQVDHLGGWSGDGVSCSLRGL